MNSEYVDLAQRVSRLETQVEELRKDIQLLRNERSARFESSKKAESILCEVFRDVFHVDARFEDIRGLSMKNYAEWDSLRQVEFILALEKRTGVVIESSFVSRLISIAEAYDFLIDNL